MSWCSLSVIYMFCAIYLLLQATFLSTSQFHHSLDVTSSPVREHCEHQKVFLENECICNYPSELGSFLRHILRSVALMHWWICQATNNRRRICKQQWRLSSSCLRCCLFNRVLRWWCYYYFFCQPVNLHHSDKKPNRILLILFIKMTFLNFD